MLLRAALLSLLLPVYLVTGDEGSLAAAASCSFAGAAIACHAAHYSGATAAPLGSSVTAHAVAAVPIDACAPMAPCGSGSGGACIAVARRGGCAFGDKAARAQEAGYRALVIVDSSDAPAPPGLGEAPIAIAVAMVGKSDGDAVIGRLSRGGGGSGGGSSEGAAAAAAAGAALPLMTISFTQPKATAAAPTSCTAYVSFGVVGGLVNQMWSILNAVSLVHTQLGALGGGGGRACGAEQCAAADSSCHGAARAAAPPPSSSSSSSSFAVALVLPRLSLNNEDGPAVAFGALFDEEHFASRLAALGFGAAPVLPPGPLRAHCAAQKMRGGGAPPPRATLAAWARGERVACLSGAATFGYGGPLECAMCSVRNRSLFQPPASPYAGLLRPSSRFAAAEAAMAARLATLPLARRREEEEEEEGRGAAGAGAARAPVVEFAAVHLRVEDDFREACEALWDAADHPTACWLGEADVAEALASGVGGLGALAGGSLLYVASGARREQMPTLCARFACFTKHDLLTPQIVAALDDGGWLPAGGGGGGGGASSALEHREAMALLDFSFALRATRGFYGNAWSTFSVELLARHRAAGRGGAFYNTWRDASRTEWGLVDPPQQMLPAVS